ncbi:hypothetical protein CPT34_21775 [Rhizobium sophoriradicis]|uniref:Uncharacterized protein n=1 Tax=Rhizobium sophoriradicis TaxID=1535245 RepID=A0A2A5KPQ4_9HYPH|nr:hypothetical protein CPT34_21775 [Rhizobium sophoriradicis]
MAVIPWAVALWKKIGFWWRRGSMSWDLASDGVGRQFSWGHAQSSGAAAWRMEEFALGIHMIPPDRFTN